VADGAGAVTDLSPPKAAAPAASTIGKRFGYLTVMSNNETNESLRAASIASRAVAAGGGGFVLANAAGVALAAVLPMPHADAVMAGILLTFAIYVAAIVWAFAARSASRAWLGLAVPIVLSFVLIAAVDWGAG
jgi:hypothetical protein